MSFGMLEVFRRFGGLDPMRILPGALPVPSVEEREEWLVGVMGVELYSRWGLVS